MAMWARTPVDQNCDHSSQTTQCHLPIMLDFISLLEELPNRDSSHFLLNHFHKKCLQNVCPLSEFLLLFQDGDLFTELADHCELQFPEAVILL